MMLETQLENFFSHHSSLAQQASYAVAVSGGPDSMTLAYSLVVWAQKNKKTVGRFKFWTTVRAPQCDLECG